MKSMWNPLSNRIENIWDLNSEELERQKTQMTIFIRIFRRNLWMDTYAANLWEALNNSIHDSEYKISQPNVEIFFKMVLIGIENGSHNYPTAM